MAPWPKIILREYEHAGRKYRVYPPTDGQIRSAKTTRHNMEAHSLNKNQVGVYDETVNMLAAILTPEGMDPATKDLEKVKEEILALPFGFIIRVMGDLGELGSSMKKASS